MTEKKHRPVKRVYIVRKLAALLCALMLLTACGASGDTAGSNQQTGRADDGRLSVVVTIFPLYDWTKNILGDDTDATLTFLLSSGVDLHSFQPTASDVMTISGCDLFLYVGGESDEWVEAAIAEAANPDLVAVNLLELLGTRAREETLLEGMQEEDAHEHDHGDEAHDHDHGEEAHDHEEAHAYDEHIWLSLQNAAYLIPLIADALGEADPDHAAIYKERAAAYCAEIEALDAAYRTTIDAAKGKTLLFCDRFPFRYLADDYGLTCYAAFQGCSAETEASFETIAFLSEKVKELSLSHVLTIEGSDAKIAQAVLDSAGASRTADVLALDSMQATTAQDADKGATYLSVMEKNLEVIAAALGEAAGH